MSQISDCSHPRGRIVINGQLEGWLCANCHTVKFVDPQTNTLKIVAVEPMPRPAVHIEVVKWFPGQPVPQMTPTVCVHKQVKVLPNGTLCETCGATVRPKRPLQDNDPTHEQVVTAPFFVYQVTATCYYCSADGRADPTPYAQMDTSKLLIQARERIMHKENCEGIKHGQS